MPATTLETQVEVLPPEKRGPGKPTLYSPERVEIILTALRKGHSLSSASSKAGLGHDTAREWATQYPEFAGAITLAESEYCDLLLDKLLKCENKFGPDAKAITFALERRFRRDWGQVVTTENRNLNITVSITGEQLLAIREKRRLALEAMK